MVLVLGFFALFWLLKILLRSDMIYTFLRSCSASLQPVGLLRTPENDRHSPVGRCQHLHLACLCQVNQELLSHCHSTPPPGAKTFYLPTALQPPPAGGRLHQQVSHSGNSSDLERVPLSQESVSMLSTPPAEWMPRNAYIRQGTRNSITF